MPGSVLNDNKRRRISQLDLRYIMRDGVKRVRAEIDVRPNLVVEANGVKMRNVYLDSPTKGGHISVAFDIDFHRIEGTFFVPACFLPLVGK